MPPSVPPRVDYALTPLGATLLDSVAALAERATLHRQEINDNRRRYDATHHAHNPDPPPKPPAGWGNSSGERSRTHCHVVRYVRPTRCQGVLVAERLCRAPARRRFGSLLEGFFPGVDPGAQFLGQQVGERVGDHLLRVQRTGLGHEAAGPDDQRMRRRGQHLADLPRPPPAQVQLQAVPARPVRVEGTPEHLEQIAVTRPRRQVGHIPPVQLRETGHRQRVGLGHPGDPMLPAQLAQELPFLVRRAGSLLAGPRGSRNLPTAADVGRSSPASTARPPATAWDRPRNRPTGLVRPAAAGVESSSRERRPVPGRTPRRRGGAGAWSSSWTRPRTPDSTGRRAPPAAARTRACFQGRGSSTSRAPVSVS
ncbi:hypothetical protein [Streptomyces sp. Tu 3180]|uniref:hypothetical protein n=1 Tax=Streptomyces sp. Tu 3180 TaxID=2682611 RepID=UPI00326089D7